MSASVISLSAARDLRAHSRVNSNASSSVSRGVGRSGAGLRPAQYTISPYAAAQRADRSSGAAVRENRFSRCQGCAECMPPLPPAA